MVLCCIMTLCAASPFSTSVIRPLFPLARHCRTGPDLELLYSLRYRPPPCLWGRPVCLAICGILCCRTKVSVSVSAFGCDRSCEGDGEIFLSSRLTYLPPACKSASHFPGGVPGLSISLQACLRVSGRVEVG
jgi:hypothetical protein